MLEPLPVLRFIARSAGAGCYRSRGEGNRGAPHLNVSQAGKMKRGSLRASEVGKAHSSIERDESLLSSEDQPSINVDGRYSEVPIRFTNSTSHFYLSDAP